MYGYFKENCLIERLLDIINKIDIIVLMKETPAISAAIAITLAADALVHEDFSIEAMWQAQCKAADGLNTSGPSVIKCVIQIREFLQKIVSEENDGLLACRTLLADAGEGREFEMLSRQSQPIFSNHRLLNIEDIHADALLEAEARMQGHTKNIRLTPEIIEWIKDTGTKIGSMLMEVSELESIRSDKAGDFRLFTTANLAMDILESTLMPIGQGGNGESGDHFLASARLMEAYSLVREMFSEFLLEPLFKRLSDKDRSRWFCNMRAIALRIENINGNRIMRIKNWAIGKNGSFGFCDAIRAKIFSAFSQMSAMTESTLNALECRFHAPRLASLLEPLINRDSSDEEIAPWETELPFGEVLYSELLPGGDRVYFAANGSFDTSTMSVRQPDISPFLESQLTFRSTADCTYLIAQNALSSTVRFGNQVCPGDVYTSVNPSLVHSPVTQTLFLVDKALRKKINDIWCAQPALISLAATAAPLCIMRDGDSVFLGCHAKGESALQKIVGEHAERIDAATMAVTLGLHMRGAKNNMAAFRVPVSLINVDNGDEPIETVESDNTIEEHTNGEHHPQSVRAVLQKRLGAASVKSYHDYITALRKLGVRERQANGSHIALSTDSGGFALHSHNFRKHGNSPVNLGFVSRELGQLHITPEAFLIALGY